MTKMFTYPSPDGQLVRMETWNVFTGCRHSCLYCWARRRAETRMKHLLRYKEGFVPRFNGEELDRGFKPGTMVFVAAMGDISWATDEEIDRILMRVLDFPSTKFLFCTKDPQVYRRFANWPDNAILGATIETTSAHLSQKYSAAPLTLDRKTALMLAPHKHKFVSIEPIMDLDVDVMVRWMHFVDPEIVEVGADNYHNGLIEPSADTVNQLLQRLRRFVPLVVEKEGLERLKGGPK